MNVRCRVRLVPSLRLYNGSVTSVQRQRDREWGANFAAILVCHFLNFVLIQASFPFIPLYLRELGESESSAIAWTGLMQVVSSGMMMVANPVWGSLSDRFGRKAMITRAQTAAVAVYGLMGLTTQTWQVVGLRVLQGAVGGSGAPLTTLAAVTLPPHRLSMGMGVFQTAQFVGVSAGPVLGGLVAAAIGFRGTFHVTAGLMVLNALLAYFVIREPKDYGAARTHPRLSFSQGLAFVSRALCCRCTCTRWPAKAPMPPRPLAWSWRRRRLGPRAAVRSSVGWAVGLVREPSWLERC